MSFSLPHTGEPSSFPTVRTAIVGASGYSGEELVRLLLAHPYTKLVAATSRQYTGETVAHVFPKFASHPLAKTLRFCEPQIELLTREADLVFLALPHGVAAEFALPLLAAGCRVIDLSADFRLRDAAVYREFYGHDHPAPGLLAQAVYGLPEIRRNAIRTSNLVASPGCYPTSILLPLIPLLRDGIIQSRGIVANSLSGVSGAGRKAEIDFLFVECNESLRAYGVPKHRHLSEIEQELSSAADTEVVIQFIPHLVPVNRGIATSISVTPVNAVTDASEAEQLHREISASYAAAYRNEPFIRILEGKALPDTKNVVGTNVLELAWRVDIRTGRLLVLSAQDNILKGASGQAVQSMNIMCGYPETTGLP